MHIWEIILEIFFTKLDIFVPNGLADHELGPICQSIMCFSSMGGHYGLGP